MKALLRAVFALPAWLELARFTMGRTLIGEDRAFLALTERLARRAGYVGVYLRAAVYSRVLKRSSPEVHIGFGTCLSKPAATLGDNVYVGRFCSLGWVEIERDVMIADFVAIPSGRQTHRVSGSERMAPRDQEPRFSPVRIGEGTWIGAHAVVMADVGRFCIVGAGAVVTRPIADYAIALGVPARPVGSTLSDVTAATSRPEKG
jgi:acetyltransferase-like isoleucine patch superfamily enzyme